MLLQLHFSGCSYIKISQCNYFSHTMFNIIMYIPVALITHTDPPTDPPTAPTSPTTPPTVPGKPTQASCQLLHSGLYNAVSCPPVASIDNGQVVSTGFVPGETLTYSCYEGFELVGNPVRTCLANGEWSGQGPVCNPCPSSGCTPGS